MGAALESCPSDTGFRLPSAPWVQGNSRRSLLGWLIPAYHRVRGWTHCVWGQRVCDCDCQAARPKEGKEWLMAQAAG